MTVVIAIIGTITAIALTSQSTFNRSLVLTDTAYSVAFSAREAQSFGSASRKFEGVTNPGYGIHLDRVVPGSYILFADTANPGGSSSPLTGCPLGTPGYPDEKPGNCRYDADSDGVVQTYTFNRSFKISKFCAIRASDGTKVCSNSGTPLTTLDIVFTRPNTSAFMTGISGGVAASYTCADITISDTSGTYQRPIRISNLGEIAIGQTCS